MDLLSLRYFQVVARREHITNAAEELRVAQPSVSRTISRLETELGVPLFDRRGRRVRLNRYGTAFLRRVDRALGELADARRELADAAELDPGCLAISSETLLTLAGPLATFRAEQPQIEVQLYQASEATMTRQLRAREVDLCAASQPLSGPRLGSVQLVDEEVLLAVPPSHPLASRERVEVADLADEPFITVRPGHWLRALLEKLFADAGLTPRLTCESDEPAALLQLVSVGLGITLIPAMGHRASLGAQVAWVHLDSPSNRRTLDLVWRTDTYLPRAAQLFRDTAIRHFHPPHQAQ